MNKKTVIKYFLLLMMCVSMVTCWDPSDFENLSIAPIHQSWVFPLVNSTITFKEIVERSGSNTSVETNPENGIFTMVVRDTNEIGNADSQFNLKSSSFSYGLTVPDGLQPSFGTFQASKAFNETYDIAEDQEIHAILLRNGEMMLNIINYYYHRITGTLTILSLKNNAELSYSRTFDLGGMGSNSTDTRPLSDYTLDLYNPEDQSYNSFRVQLDITIHENTDAPDYNGSLSVYIGFNNPSFELMTGKFVKNFSIDNQFFSLSVFNSTILAEQYFAEPSFELNFENTYGTPLSLGFSMFEAINNQNEVLPIHNVGSLGPNDLDLSNPNVINYLASPSDPPATTSLKLDKNNSNIDQIFAHAPNRLRFSADFAIGDQTNNHNNFIKRNSFVSLITNIDIPLYGWATTHLLGDTLMNMPWPTISDEPWLADDFRVTLEFKISNTIPLDIQFKAVCLNEVDGVFEDGYNLVFNEDPDSEDGMVFLARSGLVDDNGLSTEPSSSYLSISLTKNEYDQMVSSPHLLLYYRLSTGGQANQSVKVVSSNDMTIQMSLHFSGTIDLNDLLK